MINASFQNNEKAVSQFLYQTQAEIDIAMCWFSNPLLFSILLKKSQQGIKVRLIVQFDQANFHQKGLPFYELIERGSEVNVYNQDQLLHHKFAISDRKRLLTGSYNWTRTKHADNVLIIENELLTTDYTAAFERLWYKTEPLNLHTHTNPPSPEFFKLLKPSLWNIYDLRYAIIKGAKVWLAIFSKSEEDIWQESLKMQRHFLHGDFDYFKKYSGIWDTTTFNNWVSDLAIVPRRLLKRYCLKSKINDVIIATQKDGKLLGAGLIDSDPLPSSIEKYSFSRYVQWFEFPKNTIPLAKVPSGTFVNYRDSGLKIVAALEK
ncbi:MAG: phospholipase D-like domain-containing protein [Bacteroidota bacterium]